MTTFDGWDARLYGDAMALPGGQLSENELMHFRTKGSKNGVRRYQQPDGTWTPLGLRERKEREGWGESRKERRAEKKVAKAEKRAAKLTRKQEKRDAREARQKERAEAARQARARHDISQLTDDELKAKIARAKMEQEYRELTRSPILKAGQRIVNSYFEGRDARFKREEARAQRELKTLEFKRDIVRAEQGTKMQKAVAKSRKEERKKAETERKTNLIKAKTASRETTITGGLRKRWHDKLSAGVDEKRKAQRIAEGEAAADNIRRKHANDVAKQAAKASKKAANKAARASKKAANKATKATRKVLRPHF